MRYCKKVFQSLRFCDSYLLGCGAAADGSGGGGGCDDGPGMVSGVVEAVGATSTLCGSGGVAPAPAPAPAPDAEFMTDQ